MKYAITKEEFDKELLEQITKTSLSVLIQIPGIYETLSEHFNNNLLNDWAYKTASETYEKMPYSECCPHCDMYVGTDKLIGTCPVCGEELIACSMCIRTDLDGEEGCGHCEHGSRMLLESQADIPVQFYTEICSHCMTEIDTDQLIGKCHNCGKELIVCSECRRPYLTGEEGSCTGCEHGSRMLLEEEE